MSKIHGTSSNQEQKFLELWLAIGRQALAGKLSLEAVRWGCQMVIVAASDWRNGGVKAWVAEELGTSRKAVRGFLKDSAFVADVALLQEMSHRFGSRGQEQSQRGWQGTRR